MQEIGVMMYGKTMKKIRRSKNMTLKEATGESLSTSQLSRFENEKSIIPVDLFYDVLKNLNTSTEEFNYVKNQEESNDIFKWLNQIEKYTNDERLDELRGLKKEIEKTRPSIYSWPQFIIYFIESVLATYEERDSTAKLPVLDYLMQVEDWGEMELRLYVMFGFILDIETTYILMKTALKRSKKYQEIPASAKILHTILSNNFSTFLAYNHLDYAEEVIELFETEYSEDTDNLAPHIDFIFNKGLLAFKKQEPKKAKKYCEQAISICRLFKQIEKEKTYTRRYKNWKENYNKNEEYKEITIKLGFPE